MSRMLCTTAAIHRMQLLPNHQPNIQNRVMQRTFVADTAFHLLRGVWRILESHSDDGSLTATDGCKFTLIIGYCIADTQYSFRVLVHPVYLRTRDCGCKRCWLTKTDIGPSESLVHTMPTAWESAPPPVLILVK